MSFYDGTDSSGKENKVEATGDTLEVPEVPKGVSSIFVDEGKWIVYPQPNFTGGSFLLKPGEYEDPGEMEKVAQALIAGQKWSGQCRSFRQVAEGSMMLFDQDNFCGKRLFTKKAKDNFTYFDTKSMIIEPDTNTKKARKHPQVDLVFVLDGSASIGTDNFAKVKQFAVNVSRGLHISPTTTRIGVVQYSEVVTLEFKLATHADKGSVERAINNVQYQKGSRTMTGKALQSVHAEMDWREPPTKRVVILLTDGESHDPVDNPAKALRQDGFVVYAVGVGPTPNDLTPMVSDQGKVTSLKDFDKLEKEIGELSEGVSRGAEWAVYSLEGFKGKEWQAFPGFYTSADLEKNLGGRVGSAKRIV